MEKAWSVLQTSYDLGLEKKYEEEQAINTYVKV
jgi:hypothetical protein